MLAELAQQGIALQQAIDLLKAERIKQGIRLAELNEYTGIEGSTLSKLENHEEANPTIGLLTRYAEAVGK